MPNLTVRRAEPALPAAEYEPFRLFREMLRWDPFAEMLPAFTVPHITEAAFYPAFEVKETKDGYVFKADLPGVKESDVEITMTAGRLAITGKRESEQREKTDTWYAYERAYGSFTRTFTLPEGADIEHVKAELNNGVLSIQFPKLPEAQTKRISLKPEKGKA